MRNHHALIMVTAFLAAAALGPAFAADFRLMSSDIGPDKPLAQDFVFSGFGCTGGNQSPALRWSGAAQIKNGFRAVGYGGSCPPPTDEPHGYVMTVYALKVAKLDVPAGATSPMMLAAIEAESLGKASLTYRFGRKPH